MLKLKTILQSNIFLLILCFIILLSFIRNSKDLKTYYKLNDNIVSGQIISLIKEEDKTTFVIKGKEKIKCNYYSSDKDDLKLGMFIKVKGELSLPLNNTTPNNFNYKKYLKNQGITYTMTVEDIEVSSHKTNILYFVKNKIKERIDQYKYANYLYTFILGDKNYIDETVYQSYQNNGVVHLFCISGTHISLLTASILFFLHKLKFNKITSYIIVFLFLGFYMFITSFSASVLRSSVFFLILGLKKLNVHHLSTINSFYLTVIILLFIKPTLLNDLGFLYSASITYGLIISNKLIKGNYLKKVFIISCISLLISLPLTINSYFQINLLSIFYNILFVPLVSFILTPLTFLTLIFKFLEPILGVIIKFLEISSLKLNTLSLHLIIPKLNVISLIIYYLFLYLTLTKHVKYLIGPIMLIIILKILPLLDSNTYIYFLDVNQGDSTLIKYKNELVLIDTGGIINYGNSSPYYISDKTITLIKSLGFAHLDYLIITHGDYDHCGDALHIMENLEVKNVIFNKDEYNDLELEIKKRAKRVRENYEGKLPLTILENNLFDNENSNSQIIHLNLQYKFLFMGDATIESEETLLEKYNLDIDVLKLGHHGSDTSTSLDFLKSITPKIGIISSGRNNRYHHPKKEVLERLNSLNIPYYNTQTSGTILFKIGKSVTIKECIP